MHSVAINIVGPSTFAVVVLLSGCVPHYKGLGGSVCDMKRLLYDSPPLVAKTDWFLGSPI